MVIPHSRKQQHNRVVASRARNPEKMEPRERRAAVENYQREPRGPKAHWGCREGAHVSSVNSVHKDVLAGGALEPREAE